MEVTRISIVGLGYVGTTMAACLTAAGKHIIGVDRDPAVLEALGKGRAPFHETEIDALLAAGLASGRLELTEDLFYAVQNTEMTFVCVGTPSAFDGTLDYAALHAAVTTVGMALASENRRHPVVVRSTVEPGTLRGQVTPLLEKYSGQKAGTGFSVAVYPEFLREGSAVRDFQAPPYVVVGVDEHDADVAQAIDRLARCFGSTAGLFVMPPEQAEMLKLVCNAWHALKVAFANEVGVLCRGTGVDSRQLMDVFVRDTQLNVGPAYLRPGFAYGGSCLGKDLRALMTLGDRLEESTFLLDAVERSNWKHIERAAEVVALARGRRLGIIGLGHKPGSGDLRSSQVLALLRLVMAQNPGMVVRAYDPHVLLGQGTGDMQIEIVGEIGDVLRWCDVLIVATPEPTVDCVALRPGITIVDLTGMVRKSNMLTLV